MSNCNVEAEVLLALCGLATGAPHYVFGRVFDPAIHRIVLHLAKSDWIVVAGRPVVYGDLGRSAGRQIDLER